MKKGILPPILLLITLAGATQLSAAPSDPAFIDRGSSLQKVRLCFPYVNWK